MPNAKKLARENNLDLLDIIPSNGRVIKQSDVESRIAARSEENQGENGYEAVPMSRMRKAIARRMTESILNIPAFTITVRVGTEKLTSLKNDLCKAQDSVKVSYNDILMKCIAIAAKKFPMVNARFENGEIRLYPHTNIGLAISVENGLIVPVVRNTEVLSIIEIAKANRSHIENAKAGKLSPDDLDCGSITISNLGMFGVDHFTAIINPPESCILAVGSIETIPFWDGSGWVPAPMMAITGSFDHRFIDGAYGAEFMNTLKKIIENPAVMLC